MYSSKFLVLCLSFNFLNCLIYLDLKSLSNYSDGSLRHPYTNMTYALSQNNQNIQDLHFYFIYNAKAYPFFEEFPMNYSIYLASARYII